MASDPRAPGQPLARQWAFDHDPASVRAAREFAKGTLADWGIADRCDDVRLCVSELATNAVVHGDGSATGFLLGISVADHLLRVEVHDTGPGLPQRREPDDDSDSGRGLLLVSKYADGWGTERTGQHKVVWAEFKIIAALPQVIACSRLIPRPYVADSRCPPQRPSATDGMEAAPIPSTKGSTDE
ncbi:anti-sigma regulatory factor (Ser/Thr protein kinase) [Streptomyces sp. SLBN-118]|uniref:ATP-binding protein n=1 Tax=Streptomyces sp. SLBN-118 TaxID=2768454 RepID=UPI0011535EEE|nr:ATP-binding protein [Streptomyces sp. SLBN-118]TQK45290.1 anti-sigma regulatory factor (Ser/Thr protein kinase) [Streptomyces sp. SLBN-118]